MTKSSMRLFHYFTLVCVILSYTPLALPQGQTTGAIQGRAHEFGTDAPVVKAIITVKSQDSGVERTTVTAADGSYTISILPPGLYTISITADGFESQSISNFPVHLSKINQVQPPPFELKRPGPATPIVQAPPVTQPSPAPPGSIAEQLANTTNATRSENFDIRQLVILPLPATRTFDDLAFLAPGVAPAPQLIGTIAGPGVGPGVGTSGQFSVNGARARSNNFTIDGSDNNDPDIGVRRQGFLALVPQTPESVQEFQIATLLWDSEFGRNLGSQVNAVTRVGTSGFHGQGYGFFNDSSLNARNAFDFLGGPSGGKDPYTRTLAGFAVGGPIIRNRTQFFSSFEHQSINASTEQHFAVPTLGERRFGPGELTFFNEFSEDQDHAFAQTKNGTTPIGQTAFLAYPLPNDPNGLYGANTLTQILPADGKGVVFSFKLTHQLSPKNALSGRYNFTDDTRDLPSVDRAINSTIESDTRTKDFSLILNSFISHTISNQARFTFGRTRLDFSNFETSPFIFKKSATAGVRFVNPISEEILADSQFTVATNKIGQITIEPFSPVGIDAFTFPQSRFNNTYQYADTLSKVFAKHSFKVGADMRHLNLRSSQERLYRPSVVFGSGLSLTGTVLDLDNTNLLFNPHRPISIFSGAQLAAAGLPASVSQTLTFGTPDPRIELRSTEYNFFINDNWHVRHNLTLDYGLRYEYNSRPRDKRIEDAFSLQNLPAASFSEFAALFPNPSDAELHQLHKTFTKAVGVFNNAVKAYGQILDGRTEIYQADYNNFAPHLGFAWSPDQNGRTAIRGGYGISYDAILGAVVSQSRNVFPNEIPVNFDPTFLPPAPLAFFPSPRKVFLGGSMPPTFIIQRHTLNQLNASSGLFAPLAGLLFEANELAGGLAFTLPENKLATPYAQQWHLTIEHQLGADYLVSASYVGTKGTKLTRLTTPNGGASVTPFLPFIDKLKSMGQVIPLPSPVFFPDRETIISGTGLLRNSLGLGVQERAIPELGPYQLFTDSANSSYNAFQFEVRKRYNHGYSFTVAYTWSHALDDVSDLFPIAGAPTLAEDSQNLSLERADANFDIRHRLVASAIWDVPIFRNSTGRMASVLGGWQLASIFNAHTGQPFTLNLPVDANLDGNLTDRPSTTDGLTFFDGHGSQKVSSGNHTVEDFLVLGRDGSVGRNTVRADGFVNLDLAFNKNFRFSERQNLQFRTEFFNLFNRANFGIPIRVIGAPGFGSSVDTVNPARAIQFALKYQF